MATVEFLVPQEKFLEAGAHIGTRNKNGAMAEFIYKVRDDGLHVLDLKKLNERLNAAAVLLASFDKSGVFVVSNKDNAAQPIEKFCSVAGFNALVGRFTPGRFTNPSREDFVEPKLVLVVDPSTDKQAVKEAFSVSVPVIALCDTNNNPSMVDLIVPTNNKGRKAIGLIFWILAREVLKARGEIKANEEFTEKQEEFEAAFTPLATANSEGQ
ncbi:MAG: 30S ribosomal protein S2 [Candidatus Norongarragalinales archaeon]